MTKGKVHTITSGYARLAELAALEDGWLDGEGIAPTNQAVEVAYNLHLVFQNSGDVGYGIFPSTEGGIWFEWPQRGRTVSGLKAVTVSPTGKLRFFTS